VKAEIERIKVVKSTRIFDVQNKLTYVDLPVRLKAVRCLSEIDDPFALSFFKQTIPSFVNEENC